MILKTIKNILEKLEKGMTLTKIINRCENAVKRDKVKRLQKKLINAQMYAKTGLGKHLLYWIEPIHS